MVSINPITRKKTMKKYIFMAVAGMLALSSCSSDDNEQTPQNAPRQMTFTAGFGDGTQTRTTLNADKSVEFDNDDAISIFSENNTNVQFTTTAGGATAEFTGTAVAGDATYYAVYPYNDSYTFSGGIVSGVTIDEYQPMNTIEGETWFKSSVISYATATGSELQFHNACALLKITNNTGHGSAVIEISADQSLVGTFDLNTSTGALTVTDGKTLVATSIAVEDATVYLAIAPGTYTNFTAAKSNWDDAGEWYSKTKASVTFQAGKIYDLGTTSSWMTQQAPAVESPLANTLTTAEMTVKVNYNYGGANYCLYVSNGDGTYLFSSGDGFAGGGGSRAKALVVEGGKLVFKQNFFASIDDMWNMFGFSVTFDTSNNTYSEWIGENAKNQFNPSFISVEVNGTEISLTPAPAETADVTWNFSELSGTFVLEMGYTNGVTLSGNGNLDFDMDMLNAAGDCTFTAPTGKNFKKIVINATGMANISGSDWTNDGDSGNFTSTWTGSASHTVSFSGMASNISSIEFYLEDE